MTTPNPQPQQEFKADQSWQALVALLTGQLPTVDVQPVSGKDFDPAGQLIITPPSVRISFEGYGFTSTSDAQRLSYEATGKYLVMCAEENLSADPIRQAYDSLVLARRITSLLAGARIVLQDGDVSEPVRLVSMDPLPVDGIGTAYAVAIEVPGLAQYPGTNANPYGGQ